MAEEMVKTENTNVETDSDVMQFKADTKTVEELQAELDKANARYSKLKGTLDNKLKELGDATKRERARMSEEELKAKEVEEIKAQYEQLLHEKKVGETEKRFLKLGFGEDMATEGAKALCEGDHDALFDIIGQMISDSIANEKSVLLKSMPKPQNGSSGDEVTPEQFAKMGYKDRVALMNKNPDLYRKLTS